MKQFQILFANTIQKEYYSRLSLTVAVITLLLMILVNSLFDFAQMQEERLEIFFFIITLWNGILAAMLGVNIIKSDTGSSMIQQLLAFPMERGIYLVARIAGALALIFLYYLVSLLLAVLVFGAGGGVHLSLLLSLLAGLPVLLVYIMLGVFFSLFLSRIPAFLSAVLLALLASIANNYYYNVDWQAFYLLKDFSVFKLLGLLLHFVFPRLVFFNAVASSAISGEALPFNFWLEAGHFALTSALFYLLIREIFRRRQF